MFVYWLMFAVPLLGTFSPVRLSPAVRIVPWLGLILGTIFLIGFRYQIGGDWINYYETYLRIRAEGLDSALSHRSVGYGIINWLSAFFGWGIVGVNTFCGTIFCAGLGYFCSRQPLPWLAWLVATPYLIIVVAMGYTAQSVALGAVMFSYIFLSERRILLFIISVGFAFLFHKSAIIIFPLLLREFKTAG